MFQIINLTLSRTSTPGNKAEFNTKNEAGVSCLVFYCSNGIPGLFFMIYVMISVQKALDLLLIKLLGIQLMVIAVQGHKLFMSSLLNDLTVAYC